MTVLDLCAVNYSGANLVARKACTHSLFPHRHSHHPSIRECSATLHRKRNIDFYGCGGTFHCSLPSHLSGGDVDLSSLRHIKVACSQIASVNKVLCWSQAKACMLLEFIPF